MIISGRFWRKTFATVVAAVGFVSLYEVTALDSRYVARLATLRDTSALPVPGARLAFSATAYCKGITTASGVAAQSGVVAADPEMLPVGSVVEIDSLTQRYNGIYTVMDTGPAVQGRHIDIYMWNCDEARYEFGRRSAGITVLRLGWNPRASTPTLVDRLFRQREAAQPAAVPAVAPGPEMSPSLKEAAPKEPGG
jgi:3D (Asp-Asp-Asp) domain-containing protein